METNRKHPDLFTAEEAAEYLHLESPRGLETLRQNFGLVGYNGVNRSLLYWREDLDKCALRVVGRDLTKGNTQANGRLRIAGSRA